KRSDHLSDVTYKRPVEDFLDGSFFCVWIQTVICREKTGGEHAKSAIRDVLCLLYGCEIEVC
ncbi:MAG: hypothetical protein ACPHJ3_03510, partial [Rubripirellula sp.]